MAKEMSYGDQLKNQMIRQMQKARYCPFCGKPVLPFATDDKGYNNDKLEWEMKYETHWKCYAEASRKAQNGTPV